MRFKVRKESHKLIIFPYVRNVEFVDGDVYTHNHKIRLGFYFPAEGVLFVYPRYNKYKERIQNQFQGFLRQHYWRDED